MSPKRRDVVDRLRRRLEFYRRRQHGVQQKYEFGQKAVGEQSRKHALLLRQKWLESKAKKASKSKSKSDNNSDNRNQLVTKRLKHKLDCNSIENQQLQNHVENVYRFEDDEPPPAKISTSSSSTVDGISSSVSVHIIHQINNVGKTHQDKKVSTNVTVNQIIKSQVDSETDIKTDVECKQEPNEDSKKQARPNNISNKSNEDLDPELANIFKSLVQEEDIPQEIVNELNRFEQIYRCFKDSSNESGLTSADNSDSMFASNIYVDPSQGPGQVRTPSYRGVPTHSTGSSLSEGGLAAETLKQMAAQHQLGHDQFSVKSAVNPFSDLQETGSYGQRNGYSPEYYSGIPRSASTGSYPEQQQNIGYQSKQQQQQQSVPAYNQNSNKQLAHYAHNITPAPAESGPSSLQQLQNQVAHFNQGPQMEITQTQHMQVSDGSHQMQLSQTQHVQLRQPFQSISLMQQQGFATNSAMGPNSAQSQNFMGSDQMTLQPQQMLQAKMHSDPRQQTHMQQQYMGRPPPEYKMQHSNNINGGILPNGLGPNPLQTIQNMVNQTNAHQNQGYSSVKNESSDMQNGMRTAQMSAMQQQQMNISMSQGQLGYSSQPMHRQASYPGSLSQQMSGLRSQRPSTPTYNSAILRNQRPPNVNIGPDGLNISQPRMPQDWSRGMNPMPMAGGHRTVAPTTSANMMHYRTYSSDGLSSNAAQMQMQHHQPPRTMQIDTMQSQQAAMMHSNAHAQQMMLQQQRLQMAQQQMVQGSHISINTPYGMPSQQGSTYPSQTNSSQEDILNLLDTTPNQITDFLDVQTSGVGSEANWYDIEDILGK